MKGKAFENRSSAVSEEDWMKLIQTEVNKFKRSLRKNAGGEKELSAWDMTEPLLKRRARAIVRTMPEIYRRYQAPKNLHFSLGEAWMNLNLPFVTYSDMDRNSHLLYAAAIWILDQITRLENWQEIYRLLPTDESCLDELWYHDVHHPKYDCDLIYSVEYVLHHRNTLEFDAENLPRTLTSEYLAKGGRTGRADRQPGRNRKNYEALVGMIPQKAIDAAVERFRTVFWQWADRFFAGAEPFFLTVSENMAKADESDARLRDMADQLAALKKKVEMIDRRKSFTEKKPASPLLLYSQKDPGELLRPFDLGRPDPLKGLLGGEGSERDRTMTEARILSRRMDGLSKTFQEDMEKANDAKMNLRRFELRSARTGRITYGDLDDFGDVPVTAMEPLKISDPFELCFALLYLIEADDDLPWLYGAGCGLMNEVVDTLPWGLFEYDPEDEEQMEEGRGVPLPKTVTIPDWYDRTHRGKGEEFDYPRNLAQILYEQTGCMPPSDFHLYDGKARLLGKYGIRGKEAASMLMLMSVLRTNSRFIKARNLSMDMNRLPGGRREAAPEETLEELKQETQRLKAALHASDKENREIKKKLASIQAEAQRDHRELADLREYVFNQEEAQTQEEPAESGDARWPYEVQKDTLIFGGHATWTKGIKGILKGNVRLIPKDFVFDTGIIRRAEVLWIQPNALSHKMFYRIIDMARACGKPVRYFTFASWAKCAQQLAEADGQGGR